MNSNDLNTTVVNPSKTLDSTYIDEILSPSKNLLSYENKTLEIEVIKQKQLKTKKVAVISIPKNDVRLKKAAKKNFPIKELKKNSILETELELSYLEIEEQLIEASVPMKKIAWSSFRIDTSDYPNSEKIMLAKNKLKSDRISTVVSANEKSNKIGYNNNEVISQKEKSQKTADEIVFFDYSEDGNVITEVVAESTHSIKPTESPRINGISKISNLLGKKDSSPSQIKLQDMSLPELVERSRKAPRIVDTQKSRTPNNNGNGHSFLGGDNKSNEKKSEQSEEDYGCFDPKNLKRKILNSDYTITLDSVNHIEKNFERVHNFEIRFLDDQDDIESDAGSGEVRLKYDLTTHMNIRRGTIFAHNHYPTTVDFIFEGVETNMSIPVFSKDTLSKMIEELGITSQGAQLLVELDDKTEDVDLSIETKFEAKVYLDSQLKIVNRDNSNYSYVMFMGVDVGNSIIYFKNTKNEVASKIVHLAADEMYYEPNFYAEVLDDKVELFQEKLLSKCKGLLSVDKEQITPWSFNGVVKKNSINKFSTNRMLYPLGTRKYFELSHLEESVYVGRWGEDEVIVPSEDYIRHVLGNFHTQGNECLVQVNLAKRVKDISYNAISNNGSMRPRVKYLDSDGSFYKDISDQTKRLFIMGEEQGIINLQLNYTDGSKQFIQTFCSDSTYLVEQL